MPPSLHRNRHNYFPIDDEGYRIVLDKRRGDSPDRFLAVRNYGRLYAGVDYGRKMITTRSFYTVEEAITWLQGVYDQENNLPKSI